MPASPLPAPLSGRRTVQLHAPQAPGSFLRGANGGDDRLVGEAEPHTEHVGIIGQQPVFVEFIGLPPEAAAEYFGKEMRRAMKHFSAPRPRSYGAGTRPIDAFANF